MRNMYLSVKVYRDIKYMLMTLQFFPGSLLREQMVADKLGVSRTPVREAFQRLAQEGWLQIGEGRRVMVSPVTVSDIDDIFHLRMLLELYAVRETFHRGKCRLLAGELDQILSTMRGEGLDRVSFARADMEFHSLFMKNVENSRLSRFWKTLHEESSRIAIMTLPDRVATGMLSDRMASVLQEHTAIVNRLWEKDLDSTLRLLNDHLATSRDSLLCRMGIPANDEDGAFDNILDFKSVLSGAR